MVRNRTLNPNICALTLKDFGKEAVGAPTTGPRSMRTQAWARQRNLPLEEADPIRMEVEKRSKTPGEDRLSVFISSRHDVPEHLRFIPLRLYLETLRRTNPDLVSQEDMFVINLKSHNHLTFSFGREWWLRDTTAPWRIGRGLAEMEE